VNRAPTLANRFAADLADLRALHITDPDVAEHIRASLVAELVAMTQGAESLSEKVVAQ